MFDSRKKRLAIAGAAAAAAITAAVVPMGMAVAGHSNTVLQADLDGRAEVGSSNRLAGDPNGRGEAYVFGVDGDPTTLCYVLTVDKIGTAVAAHIHEGAAGTNGPVVVNLAAPADGNSADCLTEGEAGKFVGDQTVADILANPENYYVNVHNAEYPSGAIRGQLMAER
ncbi:MAG TPA: CHRD domain-containing protein [Nocardioides sp.]|nr:CHRD domain-containing protein [Nocardioides sp.]